VKLLKIAIIVILAVIAYNWVNSAGMHLTIAELLPFSSRYPHSFDYNYSAIVMIGISVWGAWRLASRRR
jgi:hypothetical protein